MNIRKCVGCGQELCWHGDNPPICKNCHADPAPLIAAWKAEALAARAYIKMLEKYMGGFFGDEISITVDEMDSELEAYRAAKVKDAQP